MARNKKNSKLFEGALVSTALKQSFVKLKPGVMLKNPVMFTVYVGTIIMAGVCAWIASGETSQGSLTYNLIITLLFI